MSSPSIDLDMNLLSSPVPPTRGARNDVGDGCGKIEIQVAAPPNTVNDCADLNDRGSFQVDGGHGGNFLPDTSMTSSEQPEAEKTNQDNEFAGTKACNDSMVADSKPTQNYEAAIQMVESWREEIFMMNVKNSILLDDLVKSGADM